MISQEQSTLVEIFRHILIKHPDLFQVLRDTMTEHESSLDPKRKLLMDRLRGDLTTFLQLGGVVTHHYPIVSDYEDAAGEASGHYFHQDLLVANFVYKRNPRMHVDVGSRVDGFVAHVASFRRIDVIDVRDLQSTGHQNIVFRKANLLDSRALEVKTDSLSCLHVLEHIGLGRYGDPIDPLGHKRGFNCLLDMLEKEGFLYVSFPIGRADEVHFNAHRVFHPRSVLEWPANKGALELIRFDFVDDHGALHQEVNLNHSTPDVIHGCGIYTFRKVV